MEAEDEEELLEGSLDSFASDSSFLELGLRGLGVADDGSASKSISLILLADEVETAVAVAATVAVALGVTGATVLCDGRLEVSLVGSSSLTVNLQSSSSAPFASFCLVPSGAAFCLLTASSVPAAAETVEVRELSFC